MSRPKTSNADTYSMRLNPDTSEEDRLTMEIIENFLAENNKHTFKMLAQDAILRNQGVTPEMFSKGIGGAILSGLETILSRFAQDIIDELHKAGRMKPLSAEEDERDEEGVSPFTRNLAASVRDRQRKAAGDE